MYRASDGILAFRGTNVGGTDDDRITRVERQLAAAQQIAHIGSWEWDLSTNAVSWSDELYRIYGLEPQSCEVTLESFLGRVHPDDRARVQGEVEAALRAGGRFAYPERIVRPDGTIRELMSVGEVARGGDGRTRGLIGTCRDVTEERLARRLQDAEHTALEMIASGSPLPEILTLLVLAVEDQAVSTLASILLLDDTGAKVLHGAAPHLPDAFNRAIDGSLVGPRAGSCGTAAFLRRAVFVSDIESDPLWDSYRDLARRHGLRACWSTPIFATDGRVLGTFALYHREPRSPAPADLALIERVTHIARIAIERRQLEEQLRALTAHVESVREDERTGIAREIHDELGQSLTALKMDLSWLARRASGPGESPSREALLDKLGVMSGMTDALINQVRRISAELRPGVLDDLGLVAALEWQAQEFEERSAIACVFRSELGDRKFDRSVSTAVFRIFQESLTNVIRHAEAKQVDATLEQVGGSLVLEVRDDGKGIQADAVTNPKSLGLLGIRERARRLGGTASVSPGTPCGTLVSLSIPLPQAAAGSPR
jgi:PAS domain S-box-containing protein